MMQPRTQTTFLDDYLVCAREARTLTLRARLLPKCPRMPLRERPAERASSDDPASACGARRPAAHRQEAQVGPLGQKKHSAERGQRAAPLPARGLLSTAGLRLLAAPRPKPANMCRRTIAFCGAWASIVVVKIYPRALGAACLDPRGPFEELVLRVIVTIPTFRTVQADIDFIRGPDEFIRQPWAAAGTEDNARLTKGNVNVFIPPTRVSEFYDIAPGWIELADDGGKACPRVAVARWKLKQETAHPVA